MTRGKKEFSDAIRASVLIEKDHWEQIKKLTIEMSFQQGRQITTTEFVRQAIYEYKSKLEQQSGLKGILSHEPK